MDSDWISTGIKELDALLGKGSAHGLNKHGIRRGSVALIRGEPGSGKTTLALQILSDFLKDEKNRAVLFSLEENSTDLLDRIDKNFHFELADKTAKAAGSNDRLYCLNAIMLLKHIESALKSCPGGAGKALMGGIMSLSLRPILTFFVKEIIDRLEKDKKYEWIRLLQAGRLLIIMDSIDAFMGTVSQGEVQNQPRILLKVICNLLRFGFAEQDSKRANTLVLTSEYHYHSPSPTPAFTESFYCDVEILLRPEPVCVPEDYEYNIQAPVGYNLNALIREEAKSIESRSFCRVLKSRASANQSRRCAYDIVTTKGIQFFETYPGDGKIVLFAENEPQRTAWDSFFCHDVPDSYPALRHEVFDRMNMQTVYEGQRRLRNIPLKTDMYLSSFDSYWVGWYRCFKLKLDLHNALELILKPKPEHYKEYCRFVNSLVRAFRIAMPDIKGVPPEPEKRFEHAKNVTKEMKKTVDLAKFKELLQSWSLRINGQQNDAVDTILNSLIDKILEPSKPFARDYSCFLQRLPFGLLRLFGEKRSDILPELIKARESFRGEDWVENASSSSKSESLAAEWLSIPYDANIGFFVYRRDILHGSRGRFNREKVEERLWELIRREQSLMSELFSQANEIDKKKRPDVDGRKEVADQTSLEKELKTALPFCSGEKENDYTKCVKTVIKWAADRIIEGEEPKTWEEVIVQCEMLDKKLMLETQTFDSYMCTMLEMVWNSGGNMKVQPDYFIENKHKLYVPLLRALHLFEILFDSGVVDRDCTVSPNHSANCDNANDNNWLFARHWYSTLTEYLTAKDDSGKYLVTTPSGASLEIMPIPVSLSRWADQLFLANNEVRKQALACPKPYQFIRKCVSQDQEPGTEILDTSQCPLLGNNRKCTNPEFQNLLNGPEHHSCWGDWNFGLLAGSENRTLAIDLINNMMGSAKIINRAFAGACVPTVTEFYKMFGAIPCVNFQERTDINLPSLTYDELRNKFFAHAKTRNEIYDFMHCAKILFGKVEFLRRTKNPEQKKRNKELVEQCINIICDIESLYDESILISPQD